MHFFRICMRHLPPQIGLYMKLLILFLCLGLVHVSAKTYGQYVSLSVKDTPLETVIQQLRGQTGYDFVADRKLVRSAGNVNVQLHQATLEEALKACLQGKSIAYRINGGIVTLVPEKSAGYRRGGIPSSATSALQQAISGTVTNEQGDPLEGVTITVKGKAISSITDTEGNFHIAVPNDAQFLVFTMIGFEEVEREIGGQTIVDVTLKTAISDLEEVAVVAYGVQKKESVVGSISTVKPRDLKVPTRSLTNALAGNIAGVIAVQRSGEPGKDDAQFWIRGVSTFGAGANPLVLVDGVERSLSNIEPEEIESFSVLKDAAATAVYGIRGANGVVLVNTRKGQTGKPTISVKSEYGMVGATRLPRLTDAATSYRLYNEANLNVNPNFKSPYTEDIIETYELQSDPLLYPDNDWIGLMMKDWTHSGRTNLNISGGGDVAKYFVSATYFSEDGIWKGGNLDAYNSNTTLRRYNFRANTDIKLNRYTDLSLNIGGILVTQNMAGYDSDHLWSWILKSGPGDYAPVYPNPDGDGVVYGGSGSHAIRSPYADLFNSGFQTTWNNNLQSSLILKHSLSWLSEGLAVKGMFSFDADNSHVIQRTREGDLYRATGRDRFGVPQLTRYWDGQEDLNYNTVSGGDRRIYLQADISYNRIFGKHSVGGLLLYNQQDFVNANANNAIAGLPYRFQGLVSKLSYGYAERYYIELNAGYNGSENFKRGDRFGFFPSVGLGWIVSEESFYKESIGQHISYLKLRGSYGYKGNDQIGGRRFAYLTTIGGGNGGWRYGLNGDNTIGGTGEDEWGADLTWELETEANIGVEARFLKGFYLQADVFNRQRSGIFLQRASLPNYMGLTKNPWGNIGKMDNRGIDVSLEYRKQLGEIDLAFRGNFTYARNKVVENDQPDPLYSYQAEKGRRYGQQFGLQAIGLYEETDFLDVSQGILREELPVPGFGGRVYPGDIKYVDYNGDGLVNSYDMVAIGYAPNPEMVYGFGLNFVYKGIDFSAFFQGLTHMDFMLGGEGFFPFRESLSGIVAQQVALDRWTVENPAQDVLFPRLAVGENINNYVPSTWWQREGSYLRLRTVEAGYTIPKPLTDRLKIGSARIYCVALNPVTWSQFKYWDPELGSGNGGRYPIQRNFSVGLNLTF